MEKLYQIFQTVDCLCTLYKHQFFGSIIVESGLVFTQLTRAVEHNLENKYVENYPISPKNDRVEKSLTSPIRHWTKKCEYSNPWTIKDSKYESEIKKINDCLLDGHGIIDNPLL